MSKVDIDQELISDGVSLDGNTFLSTLAFNGQCFLLNGAEQLTNTPQLSGPGGIIPAPEDPADDAEQAAYSSAHQPRMGKAVGGSGPRSPFAPIITIESGGSSNIDLGFNSLLANHTPHDLLMNLTPAQATLLIPYIKLYKVEYGVRYDRVDFDNEYPLPDIHNINEIEIKFDNFASAKDVENLHATMGGRISGAGIKRFAWQLKGVNPAEADKNIEAQLEIYLNDIAKISMDSTGAFRSEVDPGYASILSLLVHSPPLGHQPAGGIDTQGGAVVIEFDDTEVTVGGPDPSSNSPIEKPNNNHMLYDGKFFEVKAVVGWTLNQRFDSGGDDLPYDEIAFLEDIDKLKTVLYMQLTNHRFKFAQDGSATLSISFRARSILKEMSHDVTGTARREYLLERKKILKDGLGLNADDTDSSGRGSVSWNSTQNQEAETIRDELASVSLTRYSNIVKRIPKYIAWARPEQLKLFETLDDPPMGVSGSTNQTTSMALYSAFSSGVDDDDLTHESSLYEGTDVYGQPTNQMARTSGGGYVPPDPNSRAGNITGDDNLLVYVDPRLGRTEEHALGIVPEHLGESYLNSSVGMEAEIEDRLDVYFKIDLVEPLGSPWVPWHKDAKDTAGQAAIGGVTDLYLPINDEDTQDIQDDAMANESNSTFALGSIFEADQITHRDDSGSDEGRPEHTVSRFRRDRIPVLFMYLGDILWSIISGTPGVREDFENKVSGMIACSIRYPKLEKFYSKMGIWTSNSLAAATAKRFKLGRKSLTQEELKNMFFELNIATIPIQFDLFLEWLQRKIVGVDRDYYFFESFLNDIINDLVNPIIGGRCLPGLAAMGNKVSYVGVTMDTDCPFVINALPYGLDNSLRPYTGTGGTLPDQNSRAESPSTSAGGSSFVVQTRTTRLFASHINAEQLDFNDIQLTPNINLQAAPEYRSTGPLTLPGTPSHINFKVLISTDIDPLKRGNEAEDKLKNIWHFKVGEANGPVMDVSFDRVDVPMMREARVNRTSTAGAWQLRELYNTTVKLLGFPGILPGQTVYVVPNVHIFGRPSERASIARLLGIGGYHLVVSTHSEITPGRYITTIKALHEALPKLEDGY